MLTFDELAHVYRWNGRRVPNVTRALSLIVDLSKVDPVKLEAARVEGVAMHRMVELYSKNDLDEPSMAEWLRPRLDAYRKFLADTGFEIQQSEVKVYNESDDYAGTADLFGIFPRFKVGRKEFRRLACVDLKRSFFSPIAIGLQTAAYGEAWHRMGYGRPELRFALRLLADGTYRLLPCENRDDYSNFLACLKTYRLKESMQ